MMMTDNLVTVQCLDIECGCSVKVELDSGKEVYCISCGRLAVRKQENFIAVLAEVYGLPVQIIEKIYSIWDSDEYPMFADFVTHMKKLAEEIEI